MYVFYGLDSEFAIFDRRADVEVTVIRDQKPKTTASQVNDPVRWRTERQRQPGKRGGKDSSCTRLYIRHTRSELRQLPP